MGEAAYLYISIDGSMEYYQKNDLQMKDFSKKPTFEEFYNFIVKMGFKLDAKSLYDEFESRGWTTTKGKPMVSWVALANARNGIIVERRTRNKMKDVPDKFIDVNRLLKAQKTQIASEKLAEQRRITDEVRMNYKKELTHPHWYAFRNFVLTVKGYKCEMCGRTSGSMNIHHLHYRPGLHAWEYSIKDVMVLCPRCHKRVHGIEDSFRFNNE